MEKVFIEWETPEYRFEKRTADWFFAVGIIAASLTITAILLNNILFAIVIVLGTLTIFLYAKRRPFIIKVGVTESGFRIGRNFYPYATLTAYWVETRFGEPKIFLRTTKLTAPFVSMPIVGVNPERVRLTLRDKLVEEEINEPLSQKIMEYLGF
jgi:hypothetical protein